MKVIKYCGDIVDFNPEKLRNSLLKSGASKEKAEVILKEITNNAYDGMATKQIYKIAFGLLKKTGNSVAARYNLKAAIRLLGPAGFFFEKYIARIFSSENYQTQTNIFLKGKCVSHEIDVVLKKEGIISMVECKFHPRPETNSDVKIPMYILSRFIDIKDGKHRIFSTNDIVSNCWIATNNRFTSDAIAFGHCSNMNLLSWDFPKEGNLKEKIDKKSLYPVTCLTTLSISEKDKLLILNILLVSEIKNNSDCLDRIGLSFNRKETVLKEVSELCKPINYEN